MADSQSTSEHPFFKALPEHDTLNAAYLLWRVSELVAASATGCWEWRGDKDRDGYGSVSVTGRNIRVHRLIHQLCVGSIPTGAQILHSCDNPCCVNPAHLRLGTNRDNVDDMLGKNRQARGENINTAKMTAEKVRQLRARYAAGESLKNLAAEFGISEHQSRCIVGRRFWKHVP